MTYDKDIRVCRLVMMIIGLAQLPVAVIGLIERNWLVAVAGVLWNWACFTVRSSMNVQQKTRDAQRLIAATLDGRLGENIKARRVISGLKSSGDLEEKAWGFALEHKYDEAYGYRSFTCPKCGRLSHLPKEVEPYCIECLAEQTGVANGG